VKPPPFTYQAPTRLDEALELLAEHGDEAKLLAGGQSLVPVLAMRLARPDVIVDVNRVPGLADIRHEGDTLTLGAMIRHATLEHDPVVSAALPLLSRVAPHIGHFPIRNCGTLGGSLAHADSAAEWPAVAIALDAEIDVANSNGFRTVPAREFFVSTFTTTLQAEEMLIGVRFPTWGSRSGYAIEELARRSGDFALAGVVCAVHVEVEKVAKAGIALLGMGSVPVRLATLEGELIGGVPADLDLEGLCAAAVADLDPPSDIHASGGYRRRIAAALTARALARALEEAADA
jgi:aerobic carbon-monoxide dehydrogenase medium subunit